MEHDSHNRTDHHEPKPGFSGRMSDGHRDDDDLFEDEEEYDEFDGDDEPKRTRRTGPKKLATAVKCRGILPRT